MCAESGFAFGGDGQLDRAAALRERPQEIAALWSQALIIALWRGKPLIDAEDRLELVGCDHPALAGQGVDEALFLGRIGVQPYFAVDLSAWEPAEIDAAASASFLDMSELRHPGFDAACRFVDLRSVMTRLSTNDAELAATARAMFLWHDSHGFCARCGQASVSCKAGWQRQCPSCGVPHFPRSDPVVIMLITSGNKALLGRSPGWPDGMYSLLAGFVEPGETLEAAVRREVFEETGIRVGDVSYLASQPWPFPASLMVGMSGKALDEKMTIDPVEIEDARWITREDLAAALAGRMPGLLPARRGAIARALIERWVAGA
jgi:NAD+ diphosphatase